MRGVVKIGCVFALLHAIFVGSLAHRIFVSGACDGCLLAAFADLPVSVLLLAFPRLIPASPESTFVFLAVWFGVAGTVQWYLIGWSAAASMAKACGVDERPSNYSLQPTAGRRDDQL